MSEYEAENVVAPIQNSVAMKSQAALLVAGSTIQAQYMPSLFGNFDSGGWYTLAADFPENSGKIVYFAFSPFESFSGIGYSRVATGNVNSLVWPLPDGQERNYRIPPGQQVGTYFSTLCRYEWLHYFANGGTGMLRIYRSSLGPSQDTRIFKAPK